MAHAQTIIDLTDNPELSRRIAEAMRGDAGRVVLHTADGPLAAVVPLDEEKPASTDDFAGLKAAAGSWRDEDTDTVNLTDDPQTHFDAIRVRAAVHASAGAMTGVDRDALLADLRAQRGQDSTGRPAD